MVRLVPRQDREVKIFRLEGRERYRVGQVLASNLPDGIRRWCEAEWDDAVWVDALFQANTVSIVTRDGRDVTYVATD